MTPFGEEGDEQCRVLGAEGEQCQQYRKEGERRGRVLGLSGVLVSLLSWYVSYQAEGRAKQAERGAAELAERLASAQAAAEATARGLEEQAGSRQGLEAQLAAAQAQALRLGAAVREKEDEVESLQVSAHPPFPLCPVPSFLPSSVVGFRTGRECSYCFLLVISLSPCQVLLFGTNVIIVVDIYTATMLTIVVLNNIISDYFIAIIN